MATRFAIANGNWSNPAIWDSGTVPQQQDNVFANGYTITFDQDVTITSLFSCSSPVYVPNIATPAMTSNAAPSGYAISSSGTAYSAFAQDGYSGSIFGAGSYWSSAVINTGWLGYKFDTPKTIVRYAFYPWTDTFRSPDTWTFEGSNDGTTWVVLDSRTGINTSSNWNNFTFSNTTPYFYYRLNIVSCTSPGYQPYIYELQMTESTSAAFGITNGGTFQLPGGRTLNVLSVLGPGGNHCVEYIGTTGQISYINVNYINGYLGSSTSLYGIRHSGSGTLYITGNDAVAGPFSDGTISVANSLAVCNISIKNIGPTNSTNGANISLSAFNTVNIVGNLYGHNSSNYGIGALYVSGNGVVNITGNLSGGSQWNSGTRPALSITTGNPTINITGNVISNAFANGGGTAIDITSGSATLNVTGNIFANASSFPAIYSTSSTSNIYVYGQITAGANVGVYSNGAVYLTGPFFNAGFLHSFMALKVYLLDVPIRWRMYASDGTTQSFMYSSDYAPEYPDIKDVRFGISYNGGVMTGTIIIPAESDVQKGFVYDGGRVGTGMLTSSEIASAVWSYALSNISNTSSIGHRLKNVTTVDSLGKQLAGFNGL